MAKLLALFLLFGSFASTVCCQTYVKGNAAYWAFLITNVSVESKLSNKLTFNGDVVFSPWKSVSGNHFLFGELIPEVRFYPCNAFNGFYVGGFGAFQVFDVTKPQYRRKGYYQKGWSYALGLSLGYELRLNDRWRMDIFAGAGWQNSRYKGYYKNHERYIGWNGSGEWLPYKGGISLAYRLGK